MAKNALTPEQDLLAREFYEKIACDDSLFPTAKATQKSLMAAVMTLLGYAVPTVTSYRFGQAPDTDRSAEYEEDKQRAKEALNEANTSEGRDEADSGESPESSEVR